MSKTVLAHLQFWVVGLAAGCSLVVAAPEEIVSNDFVMREWHEADGLPSDQISRVSQDDAGFLWMVTTAGVARFDGSHFEKYQPNAAANARIRVLAWTPLFGVVAALPAGGLAVMEQGAFVAWHPEDFRNRRIQTMFVEPSGVLWLACDDGTVLRQDKETLRAFGPKDGLPPSRARTFATDGRGQVWISAEGSIMHYVGGAWISLAEDFHGSELRLASSAHAGPWVITQDRVLRVQDLQCVEVAVLPAQQGAHYVQAALEDHNGALWMGTRSQGLHIVVLTTRSWT